MAARRTRIERLNPEYVARLNALQPDQFEILLIFLAKVKKGDVEKFHKLMTHADSIDEVMNVTEALGIAGAFFRRTLLWLAGLIAAATTIIVAYKAAGKG